MQPRKGEGFPEKVVVVQDRSRVIGPSLGLHFRGDARDAGAADGVQDRRHVPQVTRSSADKVTLKPGIEPRHLRQIDAERREVAG